VVIPPRCERARWSISRERFRQAVVERVSARCESRDLGLRCLCHRENPPNLPADGTSFSLRPSQPAHSESENCAPRGNPHFATRVRGSSWVEPSSTLFRSSGISAMIRSEISASFPSIPGAEIFDPGASNPLDPRPSLPDRGPLGWDHRPTVRIPTRRPTPPGKGLRKADASRIPLVVGKTGGLFLRTWITGFAELTAAGRRARKKKALAPPRKRRRWEPIVTARPFPRGPLALRTLGFLHEGLGPRLRPGQARRPRKRPHTPAPQPRA